MKPSRKGEENCRLRKGEVFVKRWEKKVWAKKERRHSKAEEARRKFENRRILFR